MRWSRYLVVKEKEKLRESKRNSYHLLNVQKDGMEIMLEEFGFLSLMMLFDAFLICWLRRLHVKILMTRRC